LSDDYRDLQKLVKAQNGVFLAEFPRVMVACSGGVDSIVLFDVLCSLKKCRLISELGACHVNFHLRGDESDADEAFVRSICEGAGVEFFGHRANPEEAKSHPGESTQEWARRIRYEFFGDLVEAGWTIALAHHQDDLAENIILRLARGTSAGSLTGMTSMHNSYWRPFLAVAKSELSAWATRQHLPHREDPSNVKMDYSRNIIRHKILPELERLFPGAAGRIVRTAKEIVDIDHFCSEKISDELAAEEPGAADLTKLRHYSDGVLKTAIVRIIGPLETKLRKFESGFLNRAVAFTRSLDLEASLMAPGGGVLDFRKGKLRFLPTKTATRKQKHSATITQYARQFIIGPHTRIDVDSPDGGIQASLTLSNLGQTARNLHLACASSDEKTKTGTAKECSYFNVLKTNSGSVREAASRLYSILENGRRIGLLATEGNRSNRLPESSESSLVVDPFVTVEFTRNIASFFPDSK
jgi:tRNA(Ile)-lysidine synthetase-like protein